ncbi:unnamed protein product [Staurois parvus]|uniref:Uncharacterized protein n=1 Tax=Staurois parvus TaxID=386267 RepID=A0ABN9FK48_9NEOB|nr:unnamed protein product [Staurois parvus]
MGLVVPQHLQGHSLETPCCQTTSPIKLLPLGVMLATVNPAMPHGTCSLAAAGGTPV